MRACERCDALSARCAAMDSLSEADATRANAIRLEQADREGVVHGLEAQLTEKAGRVKELQLRLEESEQGGRHMGAELASEQDLRLRLHGQVETLMAELRSQRGLIAAGQGGVVELRRKLVSMQAESTSERAATAELRRRLVSMQAESTSERTAMAMKAASDLAAVAEQADGLAAELAAERSHVHALHAALVAPKADGLSAEAAAEKLRTSLLAAAGQKIKEQSSHVQELVASLATRDATVAEQQTQLQELVASLAARDATVAEQQTQLQELVASLAARDMRDR